MDEKLQKEIEDVMDEFWDQTKWLRESLVEKLCKIDGIESYQGQSCSQNTIDTLGLMIFDSLKMKLCFTKD